MRKNILLLFVIFSFVSCKNDSAADVTKNAPVNATAEKFQSKEVKDYIIAYDEYTVAYREALKIGDFTEMKLLGRKAMSLSNQGNEALKNAKGDDSIRLQNYMKQKTDELVSIANSDTLSK